MNSKQLTTTVHNINNTLRWSEFCKGKSIEEIKVVEKYAKFKFLKEEDLKNSIELVKNFDINNVWSNKFWGLKKHESICAVATEIYQNIKKIRTFNL